MHAHYFPAGDVPDEGFEQRAGLFEEFGADGFDEERTAFEAAGAREFLFGGGEDAAQANDDQVIEYVGADFVRAAAHVLFFEFDDSLADVSLNLTEFLNRWGLVLHSN